MTEDEIKALLFKFHSGNPFLLFYFLCGTQVIEYYADPEENKIDRELINEQVREVHNYLEAECVSDPVTKACYS